MPLSDFYDTGFLRPGVHEVEVVEFRMFDCKSGSSGVEFSLRGSAGKSKISFILVEQSVGFLARFAAACGLSKDDCAGYEWEPPRKDGHQKLIGKRLKVLVEKTGKYCEVTECVNLSEPNPVPSVRPQPTMPPGADGEGDCPF